MSGRATISIGIVADDRVDDVDKGWSNAGAEEPSAKPKREDADPNTAESADTIDTAKSRVVRLLERPARTDGASGATVALP